MLEEDAVVLASVRWGAKQGFTAYSHSDSLISKPDEYQHLPYWRVAMKTLKSDSVYKVLSPLSDM